MQRPIINPGALPGLDHFHAINDSRAPRRGHLEADRIPGLGSDESITVSPESHEGVDAAGAAQKILNSISTGYAIAAQKLSNTRGLGSRILPDPGEDPAPMPRRADKAMHHARQAACQTFRLHADGN